MQTAGYNGARTVVSIHRSELYHPSTLLPLRNIKTVPILPIAQQLHNTKKIVYIEPIHHFDCNQVSGIEVKTHQTSRCTAILISMFLHNALCQGQEILTRKILFSLQGSLQ